MIGIIVLNYNNWQDTERCLESIVRGSKKETFHIYCIDNASILKPGDWLQKYQNKEYFTIIYNKKNKGYAAGNNVGIKAALKDECESILIANNDVVFMENSIEGMYAYLQQHPQVGIVGPKIVDINGKTQCENVCMKTGMREKYLLRTRFHVLFPKYNAQYWGLNHNYDNEEFAVYAVSGCCFMMSAKCAMDITPFDEGTFLYEEEFIIGINMERIGWKTMYVPQYAVCHLHGASTKHVKAFAYICNVKSEIYYCKKYLHASTVSIFGLYIYRVLIYFIHCIKFEEYRKKIKIFLRDTYNEL